jgi:outer membrane protein assembly factor BamB
MLHARRIVLLAGVLAVFSAARGEDWPQWRGPRRDGVSKETGLLKTWPERGPVLAWTYKDAGTGFAPPAVAGGVVYTTGARADVELVIALDSSGKELWTATIGPVYDFKSNSWSRGPNVTPTVDGGLLYAPGSQGDVVCFETRTGKELWRKNLRTDLAGEVSNACGGPDTDKIGWGYSCSPFVDGDKLVCTPGGPGGLFAALDKKTGAVLWRSKDVKDAATYSSPLPADIGGVRQYVALVQGGLVAVSALDGSLLWEYRPDNEYPDVVCPTPIVVGDYVYASVGYAAGCVLLKVEKNGSKLKATPVYANRSLASRQGGAVLVDGFVYGSHEDKAWRCQELTSGDVKWESGRQAIGIGPIVYADGRLYVVSEITGEVGVIEASPKAFKQLAKFAPPEHSKLRKLRGKFWTSPVIADGKLYLRDQELLFCYDLKGANP